MVKLLLSQNHKIIHLLFKPQNFSVLLTHTIMDFNLMDILLAQGEQGDLSTPHYHLAEGAEGFQIDIEQQMPKKEGEKDERFLINTSMSGPIKFDANHPKASHLKHDFVAGKTWGDTDQPLTDLGIDSNLTPDAILVSERKVLELATTLAKTHDSLLATYNSKRIAYEGVLQPHGISYFILVVSPALILTNARLQSNIIEELCKRCRCGLSLERKIESLTGRVLQGDTEQIEKNHFSIRKAMKSLSDLNRNEDRQFSTDLKQLATSELTSEDNEWVAHLVRSSLRQAHRKRQQNKDKTHAGHLAQSIESYKKQMKTFGTRADQKRVTIFPMAVMSDQPWNNSRDVNRLGNNRTVPESLFKLWSSLSEASLWHDQNQYAYIRMKSREECLDNDRATMKHELRHRSTVSPQLNQSDLDYIALSGPGAKLKDALQELKNHEKHSKMSFDPDTNTDDIKQFIFSPLMTDQMHPQDIKDDIMDALLTSKAEVHSDAESIKVFDWLRKRVITQHASLISDICTELSYEYKVPHKGSNWGFKILRNHRCILLYRCTGSHVFFSLALDKRDTTLYETGRLGPSMYETDAYYVTDFSSISEDGLDHFVKALPYIITLQALLSQNFEIPLPEKNVMPPNGYWETLKTIYLLYLSNKLDSEEIVTSIRYLYMNVLQESYKDVETYIDRLPEILRSRFSCYLLERTLKLMQYYHTNSIRRIRLRDSEGKRRFRILSVKTIFSNHDINMTQLINSFYYGYVVSKSRGKIGDRNVKVLKKIITEEFWFLDNIKSKNICMWEKREKPLKHCWDQALLRYMIDFHKLQINQLYGNAFEEMLERDLLDSLSNASFIEVATLKASSREEEPNFFVPDPSEYSSYKALKSALLEKNQTQQGKRPRVILKLFETVAKYILDTGNKNPNFLEVAVWCLRNIHSKGYFVSDCFPKDQHGGDREIHVLHIKARLAQYILERFSRVICSYLPHDSIIYPKYKEEFYHNHQKRSQIKLGDHYTICKSADASKWCQRHHSSKFYLLLARYLPDYMEPFAYCLLYLWTKKRIMIPIDVLANFDKNKTTPSSNEFYVGFKNRYYSASPPFVSVKQRNTITCESGMWQGILHITSTLLHSVVQNFWKSYAQEYLVKMKISAVVDVIQGSDDSAALISIADKRKEAAGLVEVLLEMKEVLSEYVSIWKSPAKSSVGSINLIEYNSEWYVDGALIKPTARWALACLETTLVEKFVTRLDIYYGVLTQTLESGGTTFLCALIQLCQGYMHYMLLGCRNFILAKSILSMILSGHLVSLGYFPLDTDMNAGLTGLDFLIFRTGKLFDVPSHSYDVEEISPTALIEYEGSIDKSIRRDMNSTRIAFGNFYIWNKLISEASVESLENILLTVSKNPRELYLPSKRWFSSQLACALKLYQPGVKSSISSYQPNIRMMSSSAYVPSRACISLPYFSDTAKYSLYSLLEEHHKYYNDRNVSGLFKMEFPHQSDYEEFNTYLTSLTANYFYQTVELRRTDKNQILVWGSELTSDIPLLDICIRAWWQVKTVKISSTMFASLWGQMKIKYPFLRDTCEETVGYTKLNHLELYHFLQSIAKRTKKLRLQDTSSKDFTKEAVLTRIYWPGLKIRSPLTSEITDVKILRHHIFCYLTFPYTLGHKIKSIISILESNPTLSGKSDNLTKSARRLKIMRDFLVTGDLNDLILRIESLKRGVVGFFSLRQDSQDSSGTHSYGGKGTWIGKVCGISCKVEMDEGIVTCVTIARLTDLIELSTAIRSLIQEFKLKLPDIPNRQSGDLYLNERGQFESSRTVVKHSVGVILDRTLTVNVFDQMANYDWRVKIQDCKLKITCRHKRPSSRDPEFTILSDTFTSRDWDSTIFPIDPDDKLFTHWQQGTIASFKTLINATGLGISEDSMRTLLTKLWSRDQFHNGRYDVKALSLLIKQALIRRFTDQVDRIVKERLQEEKSRLEKSDIDEQMIADLYTFEDPLEEIMEEIFLQEQEIASDSPESEEIDSQIIDDSVMDRLNEVFFSVSWTFQEEEMRRQLFKSAMPLSNSFFSNILTWIDTEGLSASLTEYLLNEKRARDLSQNLASPPELRFILVLALQEKIPSSYSSTGGGAIETYSEAEISLSSFSHDYLITKDKSALEESISQLEALLPSVTGLLKDKFLKLLEKYRVELNAVNSVGEHLSLSFIGYWQFMDALLTALKDKHLWEKNIPEADILTLRTVLIADCMDMIMTQHRMEKISSIDKDEMCAVAWTEIVSSGLLKTISTGLNIQIEVSLNSQSIYYLSPSRAVDAIELNFQYSQHQSGFLESSEGAGFGRLSE